MRPTAIALAAALCLFAQPSRVSYRDAYKEWRDADPNLERDAAAVGAQLEPRTQKVSSAAGRYEAARKAFLDQTIRESGRKFAWLEGPAPESPAPMSKGPEVFLAAELKSVQRNMNTFAGDRDPGIQQLRAMYQRENLALTALSSAMADRERGVSALSDANRMLEQTRAQALDEYNDVVTGWKEDEAETDRESAAWTEYYKLLASGAQGIGSPATETPAAAGRTGEPAPRSEDPVIAPKPSITPVPLVRYTGAWTFPMTGGLYHGPQPEFADLVVHEDNGHASGSLYARFKPAPGLPGDPVLRFDFSGEFASTRIQTFKLETSDGAKGTLELIPGPAFNLIEVNFQVDAKPGKVRQGNMVLVKK